MAKQLMQQALDALRQCEFTSPPAQRPIVKDAITALREALAAPMPEPVALMELDDINELMHCNGMSVFVENPRIYPPYCEGEPLVGFVPLYFAPPAAPAPSTSADYAMGYAEGFNDACRPDGLVRETAIDFTVLYSFADEHRISYNKLCAAVRQALAAPAPVAPMTPSQKQQMWVDATIEQPSQMNCYLRGIVDAERAHGIGGGK